MDKFTVLDAVAAALPTPDIDTDMIIRIERCVRTPRAEMGRWAFEMARYRADGSENPEFPLNRTPFRGAQILVAAGEPVELRDREHVGLARLDGGEGTLEAVAAVRRLPGRDVLLDTDELAAAVVGPAFDRGALRLEAGAVLGLVVR